MEFIFLNAAGTTLFTRTDMETGHWVQQEMNVNADFPLLPDKMIERGMRIAFRDPATDNIEVFEIRNVVNTQKDHYQQITAEHIALAELSDEHLSTTEITDKTAGEALATALTGTLWSVGNNTASGTQSADFSRGSVWNAVTTIMSNWNVYITPRVIISSAGVITGRYLDITPAQGTFRGIRLSIRKNMLDPVVTFNDEDVITAMYGYGGNVTVTHQGEDDTSAELTFADQVWTATAEHPAKPSGQTYIEWPEKTTSYGRNGRPRFGYYQNNEITDAATLLQKTWESLKQTADPKISIAGTCVDLYRFGYKDQPLRLHDIVIVEVEETGDAYQKEIIMLDTDLVDPSGSRPEIGDYIPNIVYINRETNSYATTGSSGGGGGGGGGGRGKTNLEEDLSKTYTAWVKTDEQIGMVVGTRQGNNYIKAGQIILAMNKTGESGSYESAAYINADHVNISGTQTVHTLAGEVEIDANGKLIIKNAGGMYVRRTNQGVTAEFGVWDDGNITSGIIVSKINGVTSTTIKADYIDIQGVVTALTAYDIECGALTCGKVTCQGIDNGENGIQTGGLTVGEDDIVIAGDSILLGGDIDADGDITCGGLKVGNHTATWQSANIYTYTLGTYRYFLYGSSASSTSAIGAQGAYPVTGSSNSTIYYLGY